MSCASPFLARTSDAQASDASGDPLAPAGAGVLTEDLEDILGGYQWRFLWLGVVPSTSTIFAPAGDSRLLGHMGFVAWAQPAGDDVAPSDLPLGELAGGGGFSLHIWGASHICRGFEDVRSERFERIPAYVPFHCVLEVMAVTMRVWPGNAYAGIGDTMRFFVMAVKPSPSAPAGRQEEIQEALNYANPDMLSWMRRTLLPMLRAERAREPRLVMHSLCAGTHEMRRFLQQQMDQHVCHAVSGPVAPGVSPEGIGSGIFAIGPHVRLGGRFAEPHACQIGDEVDAWPMLPGPFRVSYSEAHGMWYPALFMGTSRRMREGQRQKKRRGSAD